jgi:poly(3-hydroxybutyrate) depolymerase
VPAVRNRLGIARRRAQTLVQVGLREAALAENFVYVAPRAPHTTRECVLCPLQEQSPNSQDRLFNSWISGILDRDSPQFECRAWDGSDAVANPELSAQTDADVRYVADVIDAVKTKFNIDGDRIYVVGIGTGGFMAARLACERPELFRGVVSIAGGTFADPTRCAPKDAKTNVLFVHGTADHTVPIDGGENSHGVAFPSSDESFRIMGAAMSCANAYVTDTESMTLPADSSSLDVGVVKNIFQSCRDDVRVEQWRLQGVDHFFERPTSVKLFENVVEWLMSRGGTTI